MRLKLTYLDRSRLWADLLSVGGDRVFVATDSPPPVGAPVSIKVEAPELTGPLTVSAVVQGHRPISGKFPAGISVQIDAESLERCRIAIGTPREPTARTAGRQELRADCNLKARITSVLNGPQVSDDCLVRSLSPGGFTLKGAGTLVDGATVAVMITLPDGFQATVGAQVIWIRRELELAGLRITAVDSKADARIRQAVQSLSKTPHLPTGVTVIVADDDESILDFAFRAISKSGHRVLRAERGDTALSLIRQERPQLVLLDVLMPGLDGLDVCKAMRADEHLNQIPVVLLSAMGEARLQEAARQAGANDFLTKPMHLDALRTLVAKYVG